MKLSDALAPDRIELSLSSTEKALAIEEMIALVARSIDLANPDIVLRCVMDREAIHSTGVGLGVAIPHAQTPEITGVVAALGVCQEGMDFQSLDGQPVRLIFLVLSSPADRPAYMSVISRTARIFEKEEVRQGVVGAASADEVLALIREQEPV